MAKTVEPTVRVCPTREAMSRAAAESLVVLTGETLRERDRFTVAVSGGGTPRRLYEILAGELTGGVPWDKVHVFWGDERYVSHRDSRSNFHMVHAALLDRAGIPRENVHPMPTRRSDPAAAANDYERLLRTHFEGAWPSFDLVLLGMGADGHTASLFPHSPALRETKRWVVATEAPVEPTVRLTLTLPALNAARNVAFLVAGAEKAETLRSVLAEPVDPDTRPAGAVRPTHGRVNWWLDEAAASRLDAGRLRGVRVQRCE